VLDFAMFPKTKINSQKSLMIRRKIKDLIVARRENRSIKKKKKKNLAMNNNVSEGNEDCKEEEQK